MEATIQKPTHQEVLKILPECYISLVSEEVALVKFIELCIRTEYVKLTLPPNQMLIVSSQCMQHIKEVNKTIYAFCIIANPISMVISKLPLNVQRKILGIPLVKSLKQLVLVTSMMRIMRLKVNAKAD